MTAVLEIDCEIYENLQFVSKRNTLATNIQNTIMYSKDYGLPVVRASKEQIFCDITTKVNKTDSDFLILSKAPLSTSYVEVVRALLISSSWYKPVLCAA